MAEGVAATCARPRSRLANRGARREVWSARGGRALSPIRRLPDQDARDCIERELDINLLVEAGAGSGKTESLARRMAAGIADGHYEVEGMAAVTFTRKAAAELRGRFQLELERRRREETDPVRRQRLDGALSHLERLFAGTVHAFCAHLLRERPVEAGVAPGFTEQEEAEDAEFRAEAWREYLERERENGSPALAALEASGLKPADLRGAFKTICTHADVDFPPGDATAPEAAPAWAEFDCFWQRLETELPASIEADTTCSVQKSARRCRGLLRVADRSRPAVLAQVLGCWTGATKIVQNRWPWAVKERKARAAEITRLVDDFQAQTVAPFVEQWRQYCYGLAVQLLSGGRDYAAAARRRAIALNYGDLLQCSARLLRDNGAVRRALQKKYRWLFVDEFQDTNALQAQVILLLAAGAEDCTDWTAIRPRPGALFVVGDPKQSIYRFSGADIETYSRVRTIVEGAGGKVVELTTSFRAAPALCEWANTMFRDKTFFPDMPTPQQPTFHALHAVRPAAAATGVRTLTVPDTVESADVPAFDAETVARYIHDEVTRKRRTWGNFLVLTRKRAHLATYVAALDALHIPTAVSGAAAFTLSRDVASLVSLLRALADPDDAAAVVGVLRGPLFGLSDDALFGHRQAGFGFILTAPIPDEATGTVAGAFRELQTMYRWTRTLSAPAAIERVLERTGLLARAAAATPGGAEAGNLLQAVDRVRQITEAGGRLAEAAAALEEEIESTEAESVPLEPGREDVVRVMNLHKAKGLEADVVFLADPLGGVKPRVDVRVIRDGREAVGYFQVTRQWGEWGRDILAQPAGWAQHEAAELEYVQAEEKRLLYVAATRARDLLVISRYAKAGGREARPWEPCAPYLTKATALKVPATVTLTSRAKPDVRIAARSAAAAARTARLVAAAQPSWCVESVTGTAQHAGDVGHPLAAGRTREPDTGMAWGSLVHALLENALRGPRRDRAHLERLAKWLTVGDPGLRRVVPEAVATVQSVMASEFWRQAMESEQRLTEVPFAVKTLEGGSTLIRYGIVDLAVKTPSGWRLIDYKTDQLGMDALTARYAEQARAYGRAWVELVDAHLSYTGLYGVRAGELSKNVADAKRLQ